MTTKYFISVYDDETGEYRRSDEGPWDTYEEAQRFIDCEVGVFAHVMVDVQGSMTMFAVIDSENVIWGTGDSEESAMKDARNWLWLNHEGGGGADVTATLMAVPCTGELVDAVEAVGGKEVHWEWSGTIPRYMRLIMAES